MNSKSTSIRKIIIQLFFIITLIIITILPIKLNFGISNLPAENLSEIFNITIQILLWLFTAAFINQIIIYFLFERKDNSNVPRLLKNIVTIIVFVLVITGIIGFVFKQSLTGFWATSSVFAFVIGFALRNVIMDTFAGVAVNIDQPYKIGDWIKVHQRNQEQNIVGKVIDINWRTTRILTETNNMLVIPNSLLTTFVITNYSNPHAPARFETTISVDTEVPVEDVNRVIMAGAKNVCDQKGFVDKDPDILIDNVGERGVDYNIRYWIKPWKGISPARSRDHLLKSVLKHMDHAGIKPAYPKEIVYHTPYQPVNEIEKEHKKILQKISLFDPLLDEEAQQLTEFIEASDYKSNTNIINANEDGDSMYIIIEGIVDVFLVNENKESKVARLGPGQVFGEMSLLTGEPRSATVRTISDVRVLEIKKENLETILKNRPSLAQILSDIVVERKQYNVKHINDLPAKKHQLQEEERHQLFLRIKDFFKLNS